MRICYNPGTKLGWKKREARNMQGEEKSKYQMLSGNKKSTVCLCSTIDEDIGIEFKTCLQLLC